MPERTFGRRRTLTNSAPKEPPAPRPTERTRALGRLASDEAAPEPERSAAVDRVKAATVSTSASAGWGAVDKIGEAMSDFANFLKISEDVKIIKIIDREPVDVYVCHWIDEIEEGAKSIRCWGQECPLCEIGDKASKFSACFNVVSLEDPDEPTLRLWECGIKLARQLKEIALDEKRGPLDRADLYFSIRKTQKSQKNVEYHLERVKARDLEDEHGIGPLTETEINRFLSERYTDEIKARLSEDAMDELVQFIMNG